MATASTGTTEPMRRPDNGGVTRTDAMVVELVNSMPNACAISTPSTGFKMYCAIKAMDNGKAVRTTTKGSNADNTSELSAFPSPAATILWFLPKESQDKFPSLLCHPTFPVNGDEVEHATAASNPPLLRLEISGIRNGNELFFRVLGRVNRGLGLLRCGLRGIELEMDGIVDIFSEETD
nr:hypothetical protein Iba_chr12aCG18290 [Ipomoea batatas]